PGGSARSPDWPYCHSEVRSPLTDRLSTTVRRLPRSLMRCRDSGLERWYVSHVPVFTRPGDGRCGRRVHGYFQGGSDVSATPVQRPRSFPKRVVPPIELPAEADELAVEAAAQLGWHGTVLGLRLLGKPVHVVARLRTAEHAERIAAGSVPVTDRADVSTWLWPELAPGAQPEAAEIMGILSVQ